LRFYETTIVLSPQADDATIGREVDKVSQTVAAAEGQMVTTQRWGVKRLAYPIQKHNQACYVHLVYQSPPAVPGKLESMFRINENILRHLTVLVEGPLSLRRAGEFVASAPAEQAAPNEPLATPAVTEPVTAETTEPAESSDITVGVAEPPEEPA
jgi:small subunit ribosomal protein S6